MLARAYLPDESDHAAALELLEDDETICVTGTWTRIEVSGALVRAAHAGRGQIGELLAVLDGDLGPDGPVTVLAVSQADVEERALDIVRKGIRVACNGCLAPGDGDTEHGGPGRAGGGGRVRVPRRGSGQSGQTPRTRPLVLLGGTIPAMTCPVSPVFAGIGPSREPRSHSPR